MNLRPQTNKNRRPTKTACDATQKWFWRHVTSCIFRSKRTRFFGDALPVLRWPRWKKKRNGWVHSESLFWMCHLEWILHIHPYPRKQEKNLIPTLSYSFKGILSHTPSSVQLASAPSVSTVFEGTKVAIHWSCSHPCQGISFHNGRGSPGIFRDNYSGQDMTPGPKQVLIREIPQVCHTFCIVWSHQHGWCTDPWAMIGESSFLTGEGF